MAIDETVSNDLVEAAQDEDLWDVELLGTDKAPVCANRFVLAARCQVLRKMLYGSFREAKSSQIELPYESHVLKGVVEFCSTNAIKKFALQLEATDDSTRNLVRLLEASDYLGLSKLHLLCESLAKTQIVEYPWLACATWDEAKPASTLSRYAQNVVEVRPYIALVRDREDGEADGLIYGIHSLGVDRIVGLYRSQKIAASETFLLRLLLVWARYSETILPADLVLSTAKVCLERLFLENVAPQFLLSDEARSCPFLSQDLVFDAVSKQALRASQDLVWTTICRGDQSQERVLVEDCGINDANGMYYRIEGLSNGQLYTKKEVANGQQLVYSLSCCDVEGTLECRIFSSQLLTYGSVLRMHKMLPKASQPGVRDPSFQPVLQIYSLDKNGGGNDKHSYKVTLSDSDFFIPATLSNEVGALVENGKIFAHSVVKVIDFSVYQDVEQNRSCVHLKHLAVVSDSCARFGNPLSIDVLSSFHEDNQEKAFSGFNVRSEDDHDDGTQRLYSCHCESSTRPKTSLIPKSGWSVDDHGQDPPPTCHWMAGQKILLQF